VITDFFSNGHGGSWGDAGFGIALEGDEKTIVKTG
jgi:hypothetical protein